MYGDVKRLESEQEAWNIDDSSADRPPEGYHSWIDFWEQMSGELRGICSYSDCAHGATVGGHVLVTSLFGAYIVP